MKNKLFSVLAIFVFVAMFLGVACGDELCETEEAGGLTRAYREQADSCKDGNKVNSYSVMSLVRGQDGIEKLRALLENDCIEGFRNSIGKTIADDWAQNSKVDSSYMELCSDPSGFFNAWACYFCAEILDWAEHINKEKGREEELSEKEKKAKELRGKLKILVNSEWFTEEMRDRIGLTEFDVALLKDDREVVVAMLDAMGDMRRNTPARNAELLRFMTSSSSVLQYLVTVHDSYSSHMMSSYIKDPGLDTLVMVSGPGGTAWSYSEFNHAIGIIEQLGVNWILVGDGVRGISLEDIEEIEPLVSRLKGRVMFWVHGHGLVNTEIGGHTISLDDLEDVLVTRELFEMLKTVCGNKAIDVILDSCYSGAAYKDAIEVLPEGSRFLSSAPVDESSTASGKLILNGVDHFMKSHSKVNSIFELFSLGYLYKTIDIAKGPQIFTVSSADPVVLKLDKASIDFEFVTENREKIVKYLEHYLDGETLELIEVFIDLRGESLKENSAIKDGNLSRMVQYAVGVTRSDECVLKEEKEKELIVVNEDDCEKLQIQEEYLKCMLQKIDRLRKRNQKLHESIEAVDG